MNDVNDRQIQIEDYYLSDVHVEEQERNESGDGSKKSRVEFCLPQTSNASSSIDLDSDGDFNLNKNNGYLIELEHEMKTTLDDVGLQLWRASYYLCDFLIDNSQLIGNKVVVDLGAGLGLSSFIASFYARLVFCTDVRRCVRVAHTNWLTNRSTLNENIKFKVLDWSRHESLFDLELNENDCYRLDEDDLEKLRNEADVFTAADVVYDDLITIKFMNVVYKLLTVSGAAGPRRPKVCFIANEKRINFSVDSLSAGDTAYDYFQTCLADLNDYEDIEAGYRFKVDRVNCEQMPQFIKNYQRTKYLFIWRINSIPI